MALTLLLSNVGLAALVLGAWLLFGSVSSALGFIAGDRLVPDAYTKEFGTARAGESAHVTFRLTNYLGHSVKIIDVADRMAPVMSR